MVCDVVGRVIVVLETSVSELVLAVILAVSREEVTVENEVSSFLEVADKTWIDVV